LILIGPPQNGKTTLAKSLPGQYNHIKNRWRLDMWNSAADYLIFDDVIWDEFEDLGYPSKKSFFTQAGSVNVCKPEHTCTVPYCTFIGGN
jgi:tRNA uridine 5-carbamoylmethylation protein Kti12